MIDAWLVYKRLAPLIGLALIPVLILLAVTKIGLASEKRHSAKLEKRNAELSQVIVELSTKRNEQKAETGKRIEVVKQEIRHADDKAKKIEQAPLPGNCKSPTEVLDADI